MEESGHDLMVILSSHLPGGTKEEQKDINQNSWSLEWDSNLGSSKYEVEVLPIQPEHLLPTF